MKVYALGSTAFMHSMVKARDLLRDIGLDGWIHRDYDLLVQGKLPSQLVQCTAGERAAVKKQHDYLRSHYKHILESDAVLIVNETRHGIDNYIGGNVLIEMGQAYVNDKKIFFLYGMPTDVPYLDEILAIEPICLHGDIAAIKAYTS